VKPEVAFSVWLSKQLLKLGSMLIAIAVLKSVLLEACGLPASYSRLIAGLIKASVSIDRKILADIAVFDKAGFAAIAEKAKLALA
jgi:hypothetical protein